ncbi:MAG: type VI secretion system baseplate subunit TssF [Gammaproteobacteria bacterium]|nr:type VI secretion system baseplate subunit TssF [Gammaproteobacteria bacterium]
MEFQRYFQEELAYLRETGNEFSREYPKLAPFLSRKGNDPDVERLLEGFAFFAAKLRQKIDDDLPELSQGLMQLLWPHYLRPLPSTSILKFSPKSDSTITTCKKIQRGTPVGSTMVQGVSALFRTCYDVALLPLEVKHVDLKSIGNSSILELTFGVNGEMTWDTIELDSLRLFLNAESSLSSTMYLWFFQYLDRVKVYGGEGGVEELTPQHVQPVGFSSDEEVIPYRSAANAGYRLWQEYFTLPQKFMFIDVVQLGDVARRMPGSKSFKLAFHFSRPFSNIVRVGVHNFQLHCTPIINLFKKDAEPIRLDRERIAYKLRADDNESGRYEIFEVNSVSGWTQGTKERRFYRPFISFDREGRDNEYFYEIHRKSSIKDKSIETSLSFLYPPDASLDVEKEVISVELLCTNGNLPQMLREGDVCVGVDGSPQYATFENVIPATASYPPPLGKDMLWLLISNMAPNYTSMVDVDTLCSVISLYNTPAHYHAQSARAGELRLSGIKKVVSNQAVIMRRGMPVRGMRTKIEMQNTKFGGSGEMFLFATVLAEYLGVYVALNSFNQLEVYDTDSGEEYTWRPKAGSQTLI